MMADKGRIKTCQEAQDIMIDISTENVRKALKVYLKYRHCAFRSKTLSNELRNLADIVDQRREHDEARDDR